MIFRCSKGTLSLTCKCHGNHLEVRERNPEIAGKSGRCMKEAFIIEKLSMFPKIMQQKQHGHSKCSMVMLNTNMNVAKNYYKMCFRVQACPICMLVSDLEFSLYHVHILLNHIESPKTENKSFLLWNSPKVIPFIQVFATKPKFINCTTLTVVWYR